MIGSLMAAIIGAATFALTVAAGTFVVVSVARLMGVAI